MADLTNVLNTIWANASEEYKERVPQATKTNIAEVGNPIIEYSSIGNEFLSSLVNRIALTIVSSRTARNPLSILKKGTIPLGQDIQDIFVNMSKAEAFSKDSMDLLKTNSPDVKSVYYRLNRRDKYPVTVSYDMLRTAFISYDNLNNLINGIINSLYSGDNYDEFLLMKNLVIGAVENGVVKCEFINDPLTPDGGKALIKKLRTISGLMKFPSKNFNVYKDYCATKGTETTPVVTWTPIENQVLLLKSEILSSVDVDVLATAFNMSKTDFLGRVVEVDKFDDAGNIQGILCDESFFQVWDNLTKLSEFDNPDNLTRKYIYHRWETLAVSPFANAVCLLREGIEPQSIEAQNIELKVGESKQIEVRFNPNNGAVTQNVSYTSENQEVASVSDKGVVSGLKAGSANIIISCGSIEKSITATVNNS